MDAVMYNVHDHENHQLFHFIKRNFLSLLISNKGSGQYEFDVIKKLSSKINTDQHSVDELKKMTLPYLELLNQHQLREKHITKYLVNRKFITDYISISLSINTSYSSAFIELMALLCSI
jgi:hypothetical protein